MPFRFYAHLSWTTWARLPLIDERVAHFLGPFLLAEAKRHGARVMEMGIVRDHVHLLLELPPVYDAPRLVQGLKGASARIANRDGHTGREPPRPQRPRLSVTAPTTRTPAPRAIASASSTTRYESALSAMRYST